VIAWNRLQLSTAFFWLDLDSEVVWVGDECTTEASGQTRRLGLEAQFRLEIVPWLLADLDATWVRAEFVNNPGNANAIALAPELLLSGGLTARDPRTGLSRRLVGEDVPADCPTGTRAVIEPDGTFAGCEDLHFTPGWPIYFQVLATVKF